MWNQQIFHLVLVWVLKSCFPVHFSQQSWVCQARSVHLSERQTVFSDGSRLGEGAGTPVSRSKSRFFQKPCTFWQILCKISASPFPIQENFRSRRLQLFIPFLLETLHLAQQGRFWFKGGQTPHSFQTSVLRKCTDLKHFLGVRVFSLLYWSTSKLFHLSLLPGGQDSWELAGCIIFVSFVVGYFPHLFSW